LKLPDEDSLDGVKTNGITLSNISVDKNIDLIADVVRDRIDIRKVMRDVIRLSMI
jgi:hypothetical protein